MDAPDAPTLTEKTSPGPGVEIFIESIDSDAVTATAWRVADGLREEVRGAKRVAVSGDFLATDWEVPFGVESTYVVEIFDEDGASILGSSATITVTSDEVRFSNPIDPEQQFTVTMSTLVGSSFATIGANRDIRSVYVVGLARPFIQDWGLKGIDSLPLEVLTENTAARPRLKEMLRASQILIRTPPRFSLLPRLLYASVKRPTAVPQTWLTEGERVLWTLTVDEVQPVNKAILRPLVTWGDWEDAFPADTYTWADVLAVYGAGTWTDAMRNPPNA